MTRPMLLLAALVTSGCTVYPEKMTPDPKDVEAVLAQAQLRQEAMARSEQLTVEGDALMARDLQRSVEKYREAIRTWPRAPIAYNNLGFALLKRGETGDLRDAHDALLIAAEQMPTDARPLHNLGVLMMRVGRNSEAYKLFGEALDRDPNDLGSLKGIVQAAHVLQRSDEMTLGYVQRAQLYLASSPDWGPYLARQRLRIKQELQREYGSGYEMNDG